MDSRDVFASEDDEATEKPGKQKVSVSEPEREPATPALGAMAEAVIDLRKVCA